MGKSTDINQATSTKENSIIYQPPKTDKQDKQKSGTIKQDIQDLSTRQHHKTDIPNWPDNTQQSLTDTNTASLLMTKSLAIQQWFQELENAICQLNTNPWLCQAEFLRMSNGFNKFEGQVLTTKALCKDTSQYVLEFRQESNENLSCMWQETAIQAAELWTAFAEMTQIIHSMANHRDSVNAFDSSTNSFQSNIMSVQSFDKAKHGTSPQKKKGKQRCIQIQST
jgi:hypothetical protein